MRRVDLPVAVLPGRGLPGGRVTFAWALGCCSRRSSVRLSISRRILWAPYLTALRAATLGCGTSLPLLRLSALASPCCPFDRCRCHRGPLHGVIGCVSGLLAPSCCVALRKGPESPLTPCGDRGNATLNVIALGSSLLNVALIVIMMKEL